MGYGIQKCRTEKTWVVWVDVCQLWRGTDGRKISAPAQDVYEIRPREDGDGFDLISDQFGYGPIWYAGPGAIRNAVAYAKFRSHSRSHWAITRVLDQSGAVIETQ